MARPFQDRHVVVTGGTGFLGTAVVRRLLDAGATCHIPAFDDHEIERFAQKDHERVVISKAVDLTNANHVSSFYAELPSLWASIHCAGGFDMGAITDMSVEAYRRQVALNLDTCYFCCREAVVRMTADAGVDNATAGGRIVNVAARPALEPRQGASMTAYTLAKAAVAALTQALAEEVADRGIWVNAIAPSTIDTPANRKAMPDADHERWPSTDDLAATLAFLASPENRSTRGAIVPVYGRS